jgi:hypothetical protein
MTPTFTVFLSISWTNYPYVDCSWDNSLSYRTDDQAIWTPFPARAPNCSLPHPYHPCGRSTLTSSSSPRLQRLRRDGKHSLSSIDKAKKACSYTVTLPHVLVSYWLSDGTQNSIPHRHTTHCEFVRAGISCRAGNFSDNVVRRKTRTSCRRAAPHCRRVHGTTKRQCQSVCPQFDDG